MPQTPPPNTKSVDYLHYLADSHPGRYDEDIVECCDWAAERIKQLEASDRVWKGSLQSVLDTIKAAGHDLCPCRLCGCVVLNIPTGLTLCPACAKKEAEQQ